MTAVRDWRCERCGHVRCEPVRPRHCFQCGPAPFSAMTALPHAAECSCSECGKLDRRFPDEGRQLAMFEQRSQRVPTEAEALRALFDLAGKTVAEDRGGQRRLII